jgi:hypothetical protein
MFPMRVDGSCVCFPRFPIGKVMAICQAIDNCREKSCAKKVALKKVSSFLQPCSATFVLILSMTWHTVLNLPS